MLYQDFRLESNVINDLDFYPDDYIHHLTYQQHDIIYRLTYSDKYEFIDDLSTDIVELMEKLELKPSAEEICNKWSRIRATRTRANLIIFRALVRLMMGVIRHRYWSPDGKGYHYARQNFYKKLV